MTFKSIFRFATAAFLFAAPAMADQNTVTPIPSAPLTMATLATFLNNAFLTLGSCSSGTSAPAGYSAAAKQYQCWIDTTSVTPAVYKLYDGTSWVSIGTLNTTTSLWNPAGAAATFTTSQTSPLLIGGAGTTGTQLTIKTTTGAGTTDAISFVAGNNGGTTLATMANSVVAFPTSPVMSGHTATLAVGSATSLIQAASSGSGTKAGMSSATFSSGGGNVGYFRFYLSKSDTIGAATVVASGDTLGGILWYGAQQTGTFSNATLAAQISAVVDGTVTSGAGGDMPTRLVFLTTPDGAGAPTEAMRISSTQQINIATTTDSTSSTTGSVITAGGLGVAKSIWAGTFVNVATKVRASGTAPALTACGTTPAISGSDLAGEVTMGTTATGCVITFSAAYSSTPYCTVSWQATPLASQSYTVSTAAITTVQTSTSNNKLNYTCMARLGG